MPEHIRAYRNLDRAINNFVRSVGRSDALTLFSYESLDKIQDIVRFMSKPLKERQEILERQQRNTPFEYRLAMTIEYLQDMKCFQLVQELEELRRKYLERGYTALCGKLVRKAMHAYDYAANTSRPDRTKQRAFNILLGSATY